MIACFKRLLGLDAPAVEQLDPAAAQTRVQNGAIILDVRSPLERKAQSIPGSKAMPLNELSLKWESLPKDSEIICQCASGGRSQQASAFLAGKGLKASNLRGGIAAWKASGLPTKS
jgi:phage shock protein E